MIAQSRKNFRTNFFPSSIDRRRFRDLQSGARKQMGGPAGGGRKDSRLVTRNVVESNIYNDYVKRSTTVVPFCLLAHRLSALDHEIRLFLLDGKKQRSFLSNIADIRETTTTLRSVNTFQQESSSNLWLLKPGGWRIYRWILKSFENSGVEDARV